MRYILVALTSLALLAGCAGKSVEQSVFQMRAAYDAGPLVLATQYESLPRCGAVAEALAAPLCSKAEVVAEIRKADLAAKVALDNAEDFVRNHPDLNPDVAIAAAQAAIDAFANILVIYNIELGKE